MKLGSIFVPVLVCSFVGVVACGESAEEKAAADAAKAEQAAQDTFLDTYCQIILKCCNQILSKKIDDVAGCKAHLRTLDPVTVANKAGREACITQAKAAAPDPTFCKDFAHMDMPACPEAIRGTLTGTKALGTECTNAAECAPDFTGVVDCQKGICQLRKRGKEGDGPCDTTIDGDIVYPFNELSSAPTVYNCYRDGDSPVQCDAITSTCITPYPSNTDCESNTQCPKTKFCAVGEDVQQCFNKLGKGAVCTQDAECQGHCDKSGATGDDDDDGSVGKCVDAVGEDEDCETTQWCEEGLECNSGKCTQPGPDARLASTCQP